MKNPNITRAGFIREWEGDISDDNNIIFAANESEMDDNPNWQPVYLLTDEQLRVLEKCEELRFLICR